MHRHGPSWSFLDNGYAAPDPRAHRPVGTTTMPFQLGNERSAGEWIAFLVCFSPPLICLPEVG